MDKRVFLILGLLLLCRAGATAQTVSNIRGIVTDEASGKALPYVTVVVVGSNPVIGTTTDEQGLFVLPAIPVGRYDIRASFIGYDPVVYHEVLVTSSKETHLEIAMKESVQMLKAVTITPKTNKEAPFNSMALAGARMLSVEEAGRYAGGMDDPARLVTAFAGVAGDVTSNSIAIRGNSPQFLQWKLEGVEIPNPSHYPEIGGVGGGIITAFSSQVLGNSDFFTGAFPAEYNNALAGVFDMMLRNGNNYQYEHSAQLGTLGVEVASEGPFRKGGKASYLFNYRYSTMALAGSLAGGGLKEVAGMLYQDLSFKINVPTARAGTFSLWGIATNDRFENPDPEALVDYEYLPLKNDAKQAMAAFGLGHKIFINDNTYLKSTLAATYADNHIYTDFVNPDGSLSPLEDMHDINTTLVLDTYLNRKFNARHTNRTGISVTGLLYDDNYNMSPNYPYATAPMINFADADGRSMFLTAFSESSFQLNEKWKTELGVNVQYFALNGHWAVEPRAGIRWQVAPHHAVSAAYGLHSRREKLDYYFVKTPETGDKLVNKDLDFAKAHHFVLSYDWHISDNLHLKVEPYYQYLYDVPVTAGGAFSIINVNNFYMNQALVGGGKGRNYGIEFTLERYLNNGYYYMLTASLFDSKYKGGDGVWRNARLNRRIVANALGGKEWMLGKSRQNVLGVNLRLAYMGGHYYTPVDEAASLAAKQPVEDESRTMALQSEPGLMLHFTVSYKINKPKVAHEFAIKMMNVTGYKDFYGFDYNFRTNRVDKTAVAVTVPNISYRVYF